MRNQTSLIFPAFPKSIICLDSISCLVKNLHLLSTNVYPISNMGIQYKSQLGVNCNKPKKFKQITKMG